MKLEEINEFRNTLRKLERTMDNQLKEGTDCCGVSLVQCHTLLELGKQSSTNLKDLSASLALDKSTVSRSIDTLVKKGLVSRETHAQNRKFIMIKLTETGQTTCKSIDQFCNNYYADVFQHIPEDKRMQVMESLLLFANALESKEKTINEQCGPACSVLS